MIRILIHKIGVDLAVSNLLFKSEGLNKIKQGSLRPEGSVARTEDLSFKTFLKLKGNIYIFREQEIT